MACFGKGKLWSAVPPRCIRCACACALLLASATRSAQAAVITVGGACNLTAAILAANADASVGSCPAGSGADLIELTGDVELTSVHNTVDGPNGLPSVTSKIEIRGPLVEISRASGAPKFRILHVAETGDLTLTTVKIANGSADSGGGVYSVRGGGIYNRGRLSLLGSAVIDNEAVAPEVSRNAEGGGIYNSFEAVVLRLYAATVDSNLAESASGRASGGGVYHRGGGELVIEASTVSSNIAQALGPFGDAEGGGIFAFSGLRMSSSLLFNNTALATVRDADGGGLYSIFDGAVVNTTISANRALSAPDREARGGGMYFERGTVRQSTFFGNLVSPRPLSKSAALWAGFFATLSGSTFAFSTGDHCDGGFTDGGGNLATNATCAPTIADTLDGVGALADNGGPTRTHALLDGSTAIDVAGSCGVATDQRGAARTGPCDAGAYEVIGCEILELDNLIIFPTLTSTTCSTALLGPALIIESTGRLDLTAGALVAVGDDFEVMAGGELEITIDSSLLPP